VSGPGLRQALSAGPPAVAVEDDGDVCRKLGALDLVTQPVRIEPVERRQEEVCRAPLSR
jgi:hypothetical protein